jgi:hypothetical protein
MSIDVSVDGISILDGIPPSSIQASANADHGETAFGGFDVEDPNATLTITGFHPVTITESACSQPRLFTGWTSTREVGRDKEAGLIVAGEREHDVTIGDLNALFGFRMITGTDGNRPAETWSARLTWLLGSSYLSGLITDTGYVRTITQMMDAADYRDSYPRSVCDDLVDRIAHEMDYFAFWDPVALTVGLYFDHQEDAVSLSTLRISNVPGDYDGVTTFEPDAVAKLSREPDQTYSEVVVEYKNGKVFRSRASTAAAYIRRGTKISRPYTSLKSTAITQAEWFLDQHAGELDRITATITVPPSVAGLVWAGQRMSVKFSHMPGYTTWTSVRVVACSAQPTDDSLGRYAIALELVSPRPATVSNSLAIVQHAYDESTNTGDHLSVVLPLGAPTPGNTMLLIWWMRGGSTETPLASPTFTQLAAGVGYDGTQYGGPGQAARMVLASRVVQTGDTDTIGITGSMSSGAVVIELTGGVYPPTVVTNGATGETLTSASTLTLSDTVAGPALMIAAWAMQRTDYAPADSVASGSGATELYDREVSNDTAPHAWVAWDDIAVAGTLSIAGTPAFNANLDKWGTFAAAFVIAGSIDTDIDLGPAPGVPTRATTDPTVNDDADAGYQVGDHWVNETTGHEFVLTDSTTGAAVWTSTTAVSVFEFSTTDGTTIVDPTTSVTFVGATVADLGGGVAEITLAGRDADYLVGTANAELPNEIVVGTTPGGELGGTWASPTVPHIVDATDAHDASAISVLDTAGHFTGTDVETVLDELADSIAGGGIPATLIDAKGDLIVGSAADTVARFPVNGSNSWVLTQDSGETLGMKWAAPAAGGGGALVLLEQHTAANSASLDFTTCISSTYDDYVFEMVGIIPATNGAVLGLRCSTDGGSTFDASGIYDSAELHTLFGSTASYGSVVNGAYLPIFSDAGGTGLYSSALPALAGRLNLFDPLSASNYKLMTAEGVGVYTNATRYLFSIGGVYRSTTAVNAIRFLMSSGNIAAGTIRCYGIAK